VSRRLLTIVAGGCGLVVGCVIVIVIALTVGVPSSVADRPTDKDDRVPVTAPVTQTTIEQTQVLTGSLTPASRTDVVADSGIVTAMPVKDGATVKGGQVIADVNDEPILALEMPFALWRDLDVGATGADARAVQDGLKKAGLFDGSTTAALSQSTFDALGRADSRLRKPPLRVASIAPVDRTGSRLQAPGLSVGVRVDGDHAIAITRRSDVLAVGDGGAAAETVHAGQELRLQGDDGETDWTGTLTKVSSTSSQTLLSSQADKPLPNKIAGALVVTASTSKPVLAAPRVALQPQADGTTTVDVVEGAKRHSVQVTQGLCDADRCEVTPIGGALHPGDDVAVR